MKKQILLLFFFILAIHTFAQYNCWVQFKDKNGTNGTFSSPSAYLSERAIQRRLKQNIALDSTDLPVTKSYITQVLNKGVSLKTTSKWMNGITIAMGDTSALNSIRQLPFVKHIELTLVPPSYTKSKKLNVVSKFEADTLYGNAAQQIDLHNGRKLHSAGFKGKGLVIGVLDAGFYKMDAVSAFDSLRHDNRLLGVKNFADTTSSFFSIPNTHGTSVSSIMAGNLPGKIIGTAPEASYWLIRTEYAPSEYLVEVDNWVAGIEFADSVGVDVINSSLGYSEFNYSGMNFTYQSLDGKTCRASQAATMAARKGMIVVNAAGNDGYYPWHYISTPSDADSILCVGAVDSNRKHASFSSYGPASDGRIKPDVCAIGVNATIANYYGIYSGSGTSYASPIIAGLTACVWQSLPKKNNVEVMNLMKKYSSTFSSPNDSLGYGIPDVFALYNENHSNTSISANNANQVVANFSGATLFIANAASSIATLYNIAGVKLGEWKINEDLNSTEWSSLPSGTYILTVATNSSKKAIKIQKR